MTFGERWICERKWRHILTKPHVPEWDSLEKFLIWCELSGYEEGLVLRRVSKKKPFSPGNCRWMNQTKNDKEAVMSEDVKKWNKTVNVFRKYYGLPLFEE